MARRTREDAHATRERILDAALVCLLRHGPAGATLELIATECGYSRGAIYWHFGSRQNLLGELSARGRPDAPEGLREAAIRQCNDPFKLLFADLVRVFDHTRRTPRVRRTVELLLRSGASHELGGIGDVLAACAMPEVRMLELVYQRAGALGQLREGVDTATAARSLHAIAVGVLLGSILEPGILDLEMGGARTVEDLLRLHMAAPFAAAGAWLSPCVG
ncbi:MULTISPECIES: TetR family transcriptional regulator [Stenotrophomonas]|jgi:TetR/AcrR family acrAB operon transcriptional repressor|uniref:TetR family transcriptional regulator n=1 Tax=Stenotrophomonas TaxID=40323 RepID=UPI00066C2394|nr:MULTISPECIES: TetR family transcriptional regulator [Stenotrophomonas]MBA0351540.1 TetR family transcriptional regulator [Stenotrophomonas maltophilia]MBH1693248.1 TetR family transcriptional regulator [Stenotrophomonas maltophilia]MBH1816900.1 TetR family transcriptional regulator [Stenotrophomonas maltophilia]MCU1029638.1 TetR family transcriptional regulator [Stenotrophomonas maltophilia]MDH0549313.1 TetR/AcrR family transcriptional regulator [Stenotrophomonas sp. GD04006]